MEVIECQCEDLPVTYCPKCKSFFILDKEGNREEIDLKKC